MRAGAHGAVEDSRLRARRQAVAAASARRRRRRAIALALAGVAVAGAVLVVRSPLLAVDGLVVEGAEEERAAAVVERVEHVVGEPLATVDRGALAAEVAALPWARDAALRWGLDGTVTVVVEAREPILALEAANGRWLVDADAVVIGGGEGAGLPRVEAPEATPIAGQALDHPGSHAAVTVVAALPEELADDLSHLEAGDGGLMLHLEHADGVAVRLGDAERVAEKVEVTALLLEDLRERGEGPHGELARVDTIDVRSPDRPTVRRAP